MRRGPIGLSSDERPTDANAAPEGGVQVITVYGRFGCGGLTPPKSAPTWGGVRQPRKEQFRPTAAIRAMREERLVRSQT